MMWESALLRNGTVMHRLTHILARVTVVLHMMAGCCWHHAHAACLGDRPESAHAYACRSCDDHGRGDHHAGPGERPQRHHHGCETAPCPFVVPETERPTEIAPVQGFASFLPDADTAPRVGPLAARPADAPQSRLGPDLRLHLMNQVLLL